MANFVRAAWVLLAFLCATWGVSALIGAVLLLVAPHRVEGNSKAVTRVRTTGKVPPSLVGTGLSIGIALVAVAVWLVIRAF